MNAFVESVLNISPGLAFAIVGFLVFAEDALFIGFVLPGETAAVLGGVVASRGEVALWAMMAVVVLAAVVGDTVGYEVGKRFGPRLLESRPLRKRREKLDRAQDLLRRRGGSAVFLGRFVAFFRAVMPALAGTSQMHYPRFLAFNAAGGLVWGAGCVLLGFFAGNSYEAVARIAGRDITAGVVLAALVAVVIWRIRRGRNNAGSLTAHPERRDGP
ncbi:DedA family protein [Arthrobacter sp. PAMC25564]|uniref:DedA family protein n=1 Tax=Arthrobacter sp. PAMC25564 TaxID=2565366 RepID=UPI0010A2041B|nr:DedA family protein [Arthrobacter sp. PAMC25564]QCB97730.1 DedA family protein [Arthrobacter sp. PAMC25564]